MSTILNALKRLEEESAANEASQVSVALHGQPKTTRRNSRRILICIAALAFIAGGAAIFWFPTLRPGRTPSPTVSEPQPPMVADLPSRSAEMPSTAKPSGESIAPTRRGADGRGDQTTTNSAIPASENEKMSISSPNYVPPDIERQRRGETPAATLSAGEGATRFSEGANPTPLPLTRPAAASNVNAPPVRPKQSTAQDSYAGTEVLALEKLKLQAISWSEIPTERITIIAGSILREGQNVEGYTVVEIRSNDVIVEKSGSLWKLVYNAQ